LQYIWHVASVSVPGMSAEPSKVFSLALTEICLALSGLLSLLVFFIFYAATPALVEAFSIH
jgi:hypothetical protein